MYDIIYNIINFLFIDYQYISQENIFMKRLSEKGKKMTQVGSKNKMKQNPV